MRVCLILLAAATLLAISGEEPAPRVRSSAFRRLGPSFSESRLKAELPTFRGQVTVGNEPAANATVRLKGTTATTRTDPQGRFELRGRGERITAWKEGYFIA